MGRPFRTECSAGYPPPAVESQSNCKKKINSYEKTVPKGGGQLGSFRPWAAGIWPSRFAKKSKWSNGGGAGKARLAA